MGLFGFMRKSGADINGITERLKSEPGAILLDVREADEYQTGHIPGSLNYSVRNLAASCSAFPDLNAPVYVYCQSGARSSRAQKILEDAGFTNVTNLGGITSYRGELER